MSADDAGEGRLHSGHDHDRVDRAAVRDRVAPRHLAPRGEQHPGRRPAVGGQPVEHRARSQAPPAVRQHRLVHPAVLGLDIDSPRSGGEHGVGIEKINQMCVQFGTPELTTFHGVRLLVTHDPLEALLRGLVGPRRARGTAA